MAIIFTAKALKDLQDQVQCNDHGGAYYEAAKALGCEDLTERFERINRRQLDLGHLPHDLYAERHGLYQELMSFARANMCATAYKQLYDCF